MIPSAFLVINEFPLNDNGKFDRRRVGNLLNSIPSDKWLEYTAKSRAYQAPVGSTEELLCELWTSCIQQIDKPISRTDSFFDLGGDSVTAMQLVQRLARQGMRLATIDIFNYPALYAMAARISIIIDDSAEYKRFSLISAEVQSAAFELGSTNDAVGVQAEVIDILPTTEFQVLMIRQNMSPARRQLNHFAFDADEPCDVSGLKSAISALVATIESLRTGFVKLAGQKLFQVVYANWQTEIRVFHTTRSPGAFYQDSLEQDMFPEPKLARPMFDVAVIIDESSQKHRVVFRISHALYDGATLHRVWEALEAITAGQAAGYFAPVGSYLQSLQSQSTIETEDYWRQLIDGAAISCVSKCSEPRVSRLEHVYEPPITLPQNKQSNFNVAVAVKTAWAVVLGQYTNTQDVVFADILTGRTTVHPSVADAVSCGARAVPCRVAYEREWTVERLLEQTKQQQVNSMRHESLELQQIAQRFMGWPDEEDAEAPDMRVSMTNYTKTSIRDLSLGATHYKRATAGFQNAYASADFSVDAVEESDGSLSLGVAFAVDRIPKQLARTLLHRLRITLEKIMESPRSTVGHLFERLETSDDGSN
jgi:aryl carrier-like protein